VRIGAAVAALALAAVAVVLMRRDSTPPFRIGSPTPLTSFGGHVSSPALSPDGNQIAFVWDGDSTEGWDLYVKLVGPGAPVRLTKGPEREFTPAWSPDGRQIAFCRRLDAFRSSLVVIPALGGSERTVAEAIFGPGLAWSPDGRYLVVPRREAPELPHALFSLALATGEMKKLTSPPREAWSGDVWPALSPDGGTLAYARALTRSNGEIFLLPLGHEMAPKGEPRRVTFENGAASQPAWAPDGKSVVFSLGVQGAGGVPHLMSAAVSAAHPKAESLAATEYGDEATVSRSGRLAYARTLLDENVWRLPLAAGKPSSPERLVFSTRHDLEPRISADGRRIAFTSDRSGAMQVWSAKVDGSEPIVLTSSDASTITGGARWSPDGKSLAYVANPGGQADIYVMSANGGAPRALTNHPAHDSAPGWSHDGKSVYFASNREDEFQVWRVPADGSAPPVRVTRHGGYAAIESADGKTLYYAKRDARSPWAVWKMPVGGGEETMVIPALAAWGDFDVTPKGIYTLDTEAKGGAVRFRRFEDGSDVVLLKLEKRPSFGLAACPDDSCVLFSQFDVDASEIMLAELKR
jgi:Tol biopolymer transport system component